MKQTLQESGVSTWETATLIEALEGIIRRLSKIEELSPESLEIVGDYLNKILPEVKERLVDFEKRLSPIHEWS